MASSTPRSEGLLLPTIISDLTKFMRSPNMREKIASLMPSDGARQRWLEQLDLEQQMADTSRQALSGSPTARRQAVQEDMNEGIAMRATDMAMDLVSGQWLNVLFRGSSKLRRNVGDKLLQRQNEQVVNQILRPGAPGAQAIERARPYRPPSPAGSVGVTQGLLASEF
jgi:hypothetical protein